MPLSFQRTSRYSSRRFPNSRHQAVRISSVSVVAACALCGIAPAGGWVRESSDSAVQAAVLEMDQRFPAHDKLFRLLLHEHSLPMRAWGLAARRPGRLISGTAGDQLRNSVFQGTLSQGLVLMARRSNRSPVIKQAPPQQCQQRWRRDVRPLLRVEPVEVSSGTQAVGPPSL